MTLAFTIDWLSISINVLLVVFVVVCLLMTLLILMQRPKQEGLGAAFGGGVTDQVFGASTTNVLQKGTVWLGTLFFLLSLVLAILVGQQNKQKKMFDDKKAPAEAAAIVEEEAVPSNQPTPRSLADELPEEDSGDSETAPDSETETPETPEDKSEDGER